MSETRSRIAHRVRRDPGIHFNELTRELDLAPGQVQYHLRKLEHADDVVEESLYGRTHYYTPEYGTWERGALAVLRRETARDVLVYLMTNGPSAPNTVTDGVGIARSTLEWHLDHLVEQDLVEKERDTRNRVTLVVTEPEETARMLRLVEPSVADRLVDRFTRLVDGLLGEPASGAH
ncbi:winged helix-turn-helix transcriptional regulator [Salinirubellus salinus]|jgi:predicted transcriptional regulator|uniref:Winged helix-turn-helix transcriptional regulator n=1 Tax=Salinirubellus salinus TaxID=1364945 RepID=A0A9E7U794_9EURY|nr:helix-turn-helix domain-containing protein [Salinirubellus salinus]UWM53356.1 winged helix-turn-helix transcriptional regulator [Salinirubellus salinus]